MSKDDQNAAGKTHATLTAHPPVKHKRLLLAATVILGIWLVILVSLAAYSVWG
jgi:hypothetical protein